MMSEYVLKAKLTRINREAMCGENERVMRLFSL